MSEYVTWEVCTRCGLLAAVGWATVGGTDGAPRRLCPVEFDCPTGCRLGLDELVRAYCAAGRTSVPTAVQAPDGMSDRVPLPVAGPMTATDARGRRSAECAATVEPTRSAPVTERLDDVWSSRDRPVLVEVVRRLDVVDEPVST